MTHSEAHDRRTSVQAWVARTRTMCVCSPTNIVSKHRTKLFLVLLITKDANRLTNHASFLLLPTVKSLWRACKCAGHPPHTLLEVYQRPDQMPRYFLLTIWIISYIITLKSESYDARLNCRFSDLKNKISWGKRNSLFSRSMSHKLSIKQYQVYARC